jgi:hypothetical protein
MTEEELIYAPASRAGNDNDATPNATNARPSARRHLTPTEVALPSCERARKMALSELDTSMLIGLLCHDEAGLVDLRRRVGEVDLLASFLVYFSPLRSTAYLRLVSSVALPAFVLASSFPPRYFPFHPLHWIA